MIITYVVAKIIHIITIIFFIGTVFCRTFIIPILKTKYDKRIYINIDDLTGKRARKIIKINNIFLILSGLYLFSFHLKTVNLLLDIKVSIGLTLALTFYIVPIIMQKTKHIPWFKQFFHYIFFSLMMIVLILSQIMFIL